MMQNWLAVLKPYCNLRLALINVSLRRLEPALKNHLSSVRVYNLPDPSKDLSEISVFNLAEGFELEKLDGLLLLPRSQC